MFPARHVCKILRWGCTSRLERIAPGPPPPRLDKILLQGAFYQLDNILANVRQ